MDLIWLLEAELEDSVTLAPFHTNSRSREESRHRCFGFLVRLRLCFVATVYLQVPLVVNQYDE